MIVFDRVTKVYKSGHTALFDVSFKIDPGEFVFLMGPSGSGKTTLLRLILREVSPTEGQIFVGNHDLSGMPRRNIPKLRRQIGSAFQDFKLIPDKNAFENVSLALEILGKKRSEIQTRTAELLHQVGLADKMYLFPSQLSGGEVQRVAIARAIATDPVLLFADEPTGNLDPETSIEIIELLRDINKSGTTVVMSTHDVGLAALYPHRQIKLHKGKLVEDTNQESESVEPAADTQKEEDHSAQSEDSDTSKKKKKKKKKSNTEKIVQDPDSKHKTEETES